MIVRPPLHVAAAGFAIFLAYIVVVVLFYVDGFAAARAGGDPLYSDFTSQYAGALLARAEPPENVYLPARLQEYEWEAARRAYAGIELSEAQVRGFGFARWMHPPVYIALSLPLAWLAYLPALVAWLSLTALPYLASLRLILGPATAWPLVLALGLAAPPTYFNLGFGQSGFLTAGLIGLGLALLERRPALAATAIGLAIFKPHFGVLIPLALLAAGYYRAFGRSCIAVVLVIALSVILLGDTPWLGFIGTSLFLIEGFARPDTYVFAHMTSVFASLHLLGATDSIAWGGQLAVAAAAAAIVWRSWSRLRRAPEQFGLAAAVLCLATLLAVPMSYLYDLTLAVPACAWLLADMRRLPPARGERWLFWGCFAGLLGLQVIARFTGLQLAPLLLAVLLGIALQRQFFRPPTTKDNALATSAVLVGDR